MKPVMLAMGAAIALAPLSAQAATIEEWEEVNQKVTSLLGQMLRSDDADIPANVCAMSEELYGQSNAMRDDMIALITDGLTLMEEHKPFPDDEPFSKIGKLMVLKRDHDLASGIAVRLCVEYTKLHQ